MYLIWILRFYYVAKDYNFRFVDLNISSIVAQIIRVTDFSKVFLLNEGLGNCIRNLSIGSRKRGD